MLPIRSELHRGLELLGLEAALCREARVRCLTVYFSQMARWETQSLAGKLGLGVQVARPMINRRLDEQAAAAFVVF